MFGHCTGINRDKLVDFLVPKHSDSCDKVSDSFLSNIDYGFHSNASPILRFVSHVWSSPLVTPRAGTALPLMLFDYRWTAPFFLKRHLQCRSMASETAHECQMNDWDSNDLISKLISLATNGFQRLQHHMISYSSISGLCRAIDLYHNSQVLWRRILCKEHNIGLTNDPHNLRWWSRLIVDDPSQERNGCALLPSFSPVAWM